MPCSSRYCAAGVPGLMRLGGERWSVVTESPSSASTRAPLMSATGSGSAGMPSKYGGLRTYVESSAHSKVFSLGGGGVRHPLSPLKTAPPLFALEHVRIVLGEHLGVDRGRDGVGDILLRRPDVFEEDVVAFLVLAQ